MTAPLFDTILEHAGDQLFTVYVDHHDPKRLAELWKLVHKIEELYYSAGLRELIPFLTSLGPAPNLKVLHLRPEFNVGVWDVLDLSDLPTIFSGRLPSLRDLAISYVIASSWPVGLFGGLVSLECGTFEHYPIALAPVLDALRSSPSFEILRLVGWMLPESFNPPAVRLPSLKKCVLIGDGPITPIRYIAIPATTLMFLSKSYPDEPSLIFSNFNDYSVEPALRVLGEISAVSFSITDHVLWL